MRYFVAPLVSWNWNYSPLQAHKTLVVFFVSHFTWFRATYDSRLFRPTDNSGFFSSALVAEGNIFERYEIPILTLVILLPCERL